jgi:hypothetical protein
MQGLVTSNALAVWHIFLEAAFINQGKRSKKE